MNNKGTLITVIVIVAVVLLGVIMWWLQTNGLPSMTSPEAASSTTETVGTGENDTTASIQADLDQIDTGSTTSEMEQLDAEINSL